MARLTRKNIKVFAENATNNGVFGSLQAGNATTTSNVEQIQSLAAWALGWDSATMTSEKLPPLEEFQGVQYVTTYQQAYLMQEGLPEWASTVTYYKGSLVKEVTASGFRIYNSLTDSNTNNLLSDTSNWKKVMDSEDLYAFDNTVVHNTGNETIAGVKTFSSSPQVPTAASGDNSANAASTEFVTSVETALQTQINAKAADSDVVHKTGNETIAGIKTFSSRVMAAASDINGSAVTTTNKSKSSSGYFKLGNGLIVQWGRLTTNSNGITVDFPTKFSSASSYGFSAIRAGHGTIGFVLYEHTASNFQFRTNSSDSAQFFWMAIGY